MATTLNSFGSGVSSSGTGTYSVTWSWNQPDPHIGQAAAVAAAVANLGAYTKASVAVNTGANANVILIAIIQGTATGVTDGGLGLTWATLFSGTGFRVLWAKSAIAINETFTTNEASSYSTTYYYQPSNPALQEPGEESATATWTSSSSLKILAYTGASQMAPLYFSETGSGGTPPNCTFTTSNVDSEGAVWVQKGSGYGTAVTAGLTNQDGTVATFSINAIGSIDPGYTGNSVGNWVVYGFEILPSTISGYTYSRVLVNSAGYYRVRIRFVGGIADFDNTINWKVYKNNSTDTGIMISKAMVVAGSPQYDISEEDVVYMNEGDHLNVRLWRTTGANNTDIVGTFKMFVEKVS